MNPMRTSALARMQKSEPTEAAPWAEALRRTVDALNEENGIPSDVSRPYLEEVASRLAAVVAQWRPISR
jgi:hypothetical protein